MATRKRKQKTVKDKIVHEDKPVTPEDYAPVMFWAGACVGVAQAKGLITNDQRFALREASRYLRAYGKRLYEEFQIETKATEATKEDNGQPGASKTNTE